MTNKLETRWRCVWMGGSLISVEVVSPPIQAEQSLAAGVALDVVRAALRRCVDVEVGKHACFVEAATIDLAIAQARALHPNWKPS